MRTVFLSHATADDAIVARIQRALFELGEEVWIDSRQIRGGQFLWPRIEQAIDSAGAYAVLVSPAALQSDRVTDELLFALKRRKARGADAFPVIPLTLDGTRPGAFKRMFDAEPAYIPVSSAPDGVDAAVHAILVALGRRLPIDQPSRPQPPAPPLEELVLRLTDLRFIEKDGKRRASAHARLIHEPADGSSGRWQASPAGA